MKGDADKRLTLFLYRELRDEFEIIDSDDSLYLQTVRKAWSPTNCIASILFSLVETMPICEITFVRGVISIHERIKIVEKVSALLLKAEGLTDNPIARSICLVNLNESNDMYIGGTLSDKGKIVVKIHVFHDAYSDSIKKDIHAGITDIFLEENQVTKELKGNNVWCVIFPILPNDFGVGGKPVTLELTRNVVASYKMNTV